MPTLSQKIKRKVVHTGRKVGLFPARRFTLFCHQRSGSNMLTSILNQHPNVIMRGQLFKDDPEYRRDLEAIGTVPFTGHLFDDELESRDRFERLDTDPAGREARNTAEVLESFYRGQEQRSNYGEAVGIKLHGGTLYTDELEELLIKDSRQHLIVLHRENLLAAGISWYQARKLNQWVSRSEADTTRPPMEVDVELLDQFITRTADDVALWHDLLKKHGRNYLDLTYEQITRPDFDYGVIWDALGVTSMPRPQPKTRKLIRKYDHIVNLQEVRDHFEGRNVGMV